MNRSSRNSRSKLAILTCLFAGLFCAGCGQEKYEERLQKSRLFYQYLQTVEEALSPGPWIRDDLGMSMRLPKPFQLPMPGPETFKDKDGDLTTGPDPRQKNALNIELPGLVEAWEGALDSPDGQPDAWIYLVTNQSRFLKVDEGGPPPAEFLTDLEHELMRVFQVTVPEGETSKVGDNVRFRQWSPPQKSERSQYTASKDYIVVRFVPDPEYNAADLQAAVYERKIGSVQAALIVLTRKSTTAAFRQRVETALETFEIEERIPQMKKRSAPGAPGGAASPGAAPATPSSAAPSGF